MFRFGSPIFALAAFYAAFIGSEFLYRFFNENLPSGIGIFLVDNATVMVVLLSALLAYEAFGTQGITVFSSKSMSENTIINKRNKMHEHYKISLAVSDKTACAAILSMVVLLFIGMISGATPWSDPLAFRQVIQGGGRAYFLIVFLFFIKVYGCCVFYLMVNKSLVYRHYFFSFAIILFCVFSGFTSMFAHFFLAGFVFLSARYAMKVVSLKMVVLFVFLVVITPFYTIARQAINSGINVGESISAFLENQSNDLFLILFNRFDYFDNMVVASTVMRDNSNFNFIWSLFYQPFPRAFFPDKPTNYSTLSTSWVYPENIHVGATANFGFLGEFILYFGEIGVLLGAAFMAVLLVYSLHVFMSSRNSDERALYYTMVVYPYFCGFVIGYLNDMALPTLIISLILWFFYVRVILNPRRMLKNGFNPAST